MSRELQLGLIGNALYDYEVENGTLPAAFEESSGEMDSWVDVAAMFDSGFDVTADSDVAPETLRTDTQSAVDRTTVFFPVWNNRAGEGEEERPQEDDTHVLIIEGPPKSAYEWQSRPSWSVDDVLSHYAYYANDKFWILTNDLTVKTTTYNELCASGLIEGLFQSEDESE